MGRDDYSQSSQLSTLVGKPVSKYTKLPKNTNTLKKLTDVKVKPNNRFHYSIYPSVETEYQASYSQLTKLDFYSPIITILGDNPYAHLINTPFTDPGITLDETSTLVSTDSTVNTNEFGTYKITYVATDGINPDTKRVRTVKVGEFPEVTIEGENPYILERYDQYIDEGVTVDTNSFVRSTTSTLNNTAIGNYTVNYSVSNQVFTTLHSRTVKVVDTIPPVVTILGDNPYTLERFDVYTDPGATGDLGTIVRPDLSNVQNTSIGSFTVVYNATDGNTLHDVAVTRTVNVVDTLPPVVTILGDNPYTLERFDVYTDPGATVDRGTILTTDLTAVNNTLIHGSSFVVTYTGSDGNTLHDVTQTRTVNIVDTKRPEITLIGDKIINLQPGIDFRDVDPGYEVDLGTSVTVDYSNVVTTDSGNFYVVYTASDGVNPDTVVLRRVAVADTVSAKIEIIPPNPYILELYSEYNDPGAITDTDAGSRFVSTTINVDNTAVGNYTVTYVATDDINPPTTVTRDVYVVDTTAPVASLQYNSYTTEIFGTYVDPGDSDIILDEGSFVAGVDLSNVNTSLPAGSTFDVVYDIADSNALQNVSLIRTVTIVDTVPPVVSLNNESTSYTLERYGIWSDIDPGVTIDAGSYLHSVSVANTVLGPQVVTYAVKDASPTTVYKTRVINVVDTVPPRITINEPNYIHELYTQYQDPGATVDAGSILTVDTSNADVSNTRNLGTFDVVYSATDGNTAHDVTVIRTVTVGDGTPPNISLVNGDIGTTTYTVERGTTYTDPGATADTGETVTVDTSQLDMSVVGEYTVYYSAIDVSGNEGTAQRRVIVEDTTPPVITLTDGDPGTTYYTVERGTTYTDPGATADTGETVTVDTSGLNMSVAGTYTVTYSATDAHGNEGTAQRTVRVRDTIAPVITLTNGDTGTTDYTVERGTTYTDPGATADTGETVNINTFGLDMSVNGTYTVYYSAIDASGNMGNAQRTVIVRDTTAPVITLINGDTGTTDYTVEKDTTYTDPGATADTGETVTVDTSQLDMSTIGTYTVYYSTTDSSGNSSTAQRTVVVGDTTAPVIVLTNGNSGNSTHTIERGTYYTDPGAYTTTGETVSVDTSGLNVHVASTYTVTYSATDASGNVGTAQRTVIVRDTQAPVIYFYGTNPTYLGYYDNYVEYRGYTNTGEPVIPYSGSVGSGAGTYYIYYYSVDASGNTGYATRTVIRDNPPPPAPPPAPVPDYEYYSCFSGDTSIKLENGNVINMEDVIIGDVLEGGVTVNATLQIRNIHKIPFYKVLNSELNKYIYVTGSHMIKEGDKFVDVSDSSKAEVSTVINDFFICLITDTHTIPIGENTFWDWSDTCDVCDTLTLPAT
jgi:hypothetical protein